MELMIVAAVSAYAVAVLWFIWCTHRTLSERLLIIKALADSASLEAFDDLEDVTYEQHLMMKFFFKDPMQAYSARTRTLVDNYVTG